MPCNIKFAIRAVIVVVFPVPAPAKISKGLSYISIAFC